jgi:5-amino-6-(5-phosphoribosylamino)uracil reductase
MTLHTTVVLAMSADGKIADRDRRPARFGSANDKAHLERRVAEADAVLFGAGTLRAYGTTLSVRNPELLADRKTRSQSPQPIQMVCSRSATFDPNLRFFSQSVPRWLITNDRQQWGPPEFDLVLTWDCEDWLKLFSQLEAEGIERLAVLGGGAIVGELFLANLVDELWLTVCPVILGGVGAPTPVEGLGFRQGEGPRLRLENLEAIEGEVFLHYIVERDV